MVKQYGTWFYVAFAYVLVVSNPVAAEQRPVIRDFTLIHRDSGLPIAGYDRVRKGAVIDTAALPSADLLIRANVTRNAKSVRFQWQPKHGYSRITANPFTVRSVSTNKFSLPTTPGKVTLSAIAASYPDGSGVRSACAKLKFAVHPPIPTATPTYVPTVTPTPVVVAVHTSLPTLTPTPNTARPVPPTATPPGVVGATGIPALATWEQHMLTYGKQHCATLMAGQQPAEQQLAATYYDAQLVFFQIADYTKDYATWLPCASAARTTYRDSYIVPHDGGIPGYWNFSHGLTQDYLRTGNVQSKVAELSIVQNAAYSRTTTLPTETVGFELSRETAYTLMGFLNAETLGSSRNPRFDLLVSHALGHIDQWFVSKSATYVKSFMVGLTAEALISVYEETADPRIIPALTTALDGLWNTNWVPASGAFRYMNVSNVGSDTAPAPDLNLLIAPAYAWLYYHTGNPLYRDRADQIFVGGVAQAYLQNPKQFNQNYRWSFEYVRLRQLPPLGK